MYGQEKRKGRRNAALVMDAVHIVIGILIVILAVITFLNPEGNQILLPVIFALAAVLDIVSGKKAGAAAQLLLAALLIAVTVVSAISIWR